MKKFIALITFITIFSATAVFAFPGDGRGPGGPNGPRRMSGGPGGRDRGPRIEQRRDGPRPGPHGGGPLEMRRPGPRDPHDRMDRGRAPRRMEPRGTREGPRDDRRDDSFRNRPDNQGQRRRIPNNENRSNDRPQRGRGNNNDSGNSRQRDRGSDNFGRNDGNGSDNQRVIPERPAPKD